jgi:hypothetical protein
MPFEAPRGPDETNQQYLASAEGHPAFLSILGGHFTLSEIDPGYTIERIYTDDNGMMKYEVKSSPAQPFEDERTRELHATNALRLARVAANLSRNLTAQMHEDDGRVWIVYTTDTRFTTSPIRMDSAYSNGALAKSQAERLNNEYRKSGIPESVAFSNVVPLLVQDELESWDD